MSELSSIVSDRNKLLTHQISYLIQSLEGKEEETKLATVFLQTGEVLIEQDATDDHIYLVCSGKLGVRKRMKDGRVHVVGEIGMYSVVGELALLGGQKRSTTIYAMADTKLIRVIRSEIENLISDNIAAFEAFNNMATSRWQNLHLIGILGDIFGDPPLRMTYTILPTSSNIDLLPLADELAQSLSPYGDTLVSNAERFDQFFGGVGAAESKLDASIQPLIASKMDEFEADYRYLIFLADADYSAWTQRAVGQADRLMITARSDANPELSDIENAAIESGRKIRTELVLMHDAEVQMPVGTAAWLDQRTIRNHYHLRDGDKSHIDRMTRRMSGHAIALVMGGGAAKGYAELGFYRAILETEIPYDYVGGASMGAIMGGQIALESDYEEFEKNAQWTADIGVIDKTLPLVALTSSNNVRKINQHGCGDKLIEDLWCPFFCVSTSLSTASVKVHQRGHMWRAIRASMSIPGIFVPVVEDGDVLVDGGIMDNFPIATMQRLAESNRIIGVNVAPYRERRRFYDIDTSISGWRVLFNKLNPFSKNLKTPSLVEILMRTLEVNGSKASRDQAHLADLLIEPDTRGYSLQDYDRWKPIAQCGYDASIEKLAEWKSQQII